MGKTNELQTADDLHIVVTNADGEVLLDEYGCTLVSYIVSCRGEMARSFLGAHNSDLIKIISRVQNEYIKVVAKSVKQQEIAEAKEQKQIEVKRQKKAKEDDKMLDNIDLDRAKSQIDEMSEEYGVDVKAILESEIEKFKKQKKDREAQGGSMADLDPTLEQQYKNSKKAGEILSKRKKK